MVVNVAWVRSRCLKAITAPTLQDEVACKHRPVTPAALGAASLPRRLPARVSPTVDGQDQDASMIRSVEEFVVVVREDSAPWPLEQPRWFRGEPVSDKPLLPSLYRRANGAARENQLLQTFRARAAAFAPDGLPDREKIDEWLFLAQHVGLPTRLLDWSESALIGLYFALKSEAPIVWMLNPHHLNHFAWGCPPGADPNDRREFPLAWHRPDPPAMNPAAENVCGAWEEDVPGVALPVAVHPSYVHSRLRAQRGCFTIHGKRKEGIQSLVPATVLKRYEVDPTCRPDMMRDLSTMGITEAVAYPDLDGLARDLRQRFLGEAV